MSTESRKNSKNSASDDAATPIVNDASSEKDKLRNKDRSNNKPDRSGTDNVSNYVSGDSARSSSSHQFHKS